MQPNYFPPPAPPSAPKSTALIVAVTVIATVGVMLVGIVILGLAIGEEEKPTAAPRAKASPSPTSSRVPLLQAPAPEAAAATTAPPTKAAESPRPEAHSVVYKVTGPTQGLITYMKPGGGISQANGADLPWTKKLSADEFNYLSVSVQNKAGSGKVTCSITVDGKVVDQNSSTGAYAIASCNHSAF